MHEIVAVATDDIMHLSCVGGELGSLRLEKLHDVWNGLGLKSHSAKRFEGRLDGTCMGIDLCGGVRWAPAVKRLWSLVAAAADLFGNPRAAPAEMASYSGVLQWLDLLNRPLLSCLQHVYDFNRSSNQY